VRSGVFGSARMRMAIEEHGLGQQLARFRTWPRCSIKGLVLMLTATTLFADAALDQAWTVGVILAGIATLVMIRTLMEYAAAMLAIRQALQMIELKATTHRLRQPTIVAEPQITDSPARHNGSHHTSLLQIEALVDELASIKGSSRYGNPRIVLPPGTSRSKGDRA
jgi:hypothetical protein